MPNTCIKMIDTDIDDIDDIDLDLQASHNNNNLAKLYEDRDLEMQQPPPSFNTAVRSKPDVRTNIQFYQGSQHQDDMDINTHV